MMKFRKDDRALIDYMRANEDYFRHVDGETYRVIGELLQSRTRLNSEVSKEEKDGEKDMCKALEDLFQHGVRDGKDEKLKELVEKKLEKGLSIVEIAELFEEDVETIERISKEAGNKVEFKLF